jgi:hypothetical protein
MHIGFMRMTMNLELDYSVASGKILGTELRLGIVEALLQLGHKITILNELKPVSQKILTGVGPNDYWDYSLFRHIKYSPIKIPKKLDLIFIECSSANILFGRKGLARMKEVLSNYSGKVVYYQHSDALCSLPLGAMCDGEATNFQDTEGISYKNFFKGMRFDDKEWILITHAIPELISNRIPNNRYRYSLFDKRIHLPLGYSANFDQVVKESNIKDRPNKLIYIGHEKSAPRLRRMKELYGNGCCSTVVFGNWKNPPPEYKYGWFIPRQGEIYTRGYYSRVAKGSIVIGDTFHTDTGMMPSRLVQSIRSKCLTLIDGEFINAKDVLNKEFIVNKHADVHKWFELKSRTLKRAICYQQGEIKQWVYLLSPVMEKVIS